MPYILSLLLVALTSCPALCRTPHQSGDAGDGGGVAVTGSLAELRNRRRVLLLVRRSGVVDSRGGAETILKEALAAEANVSRRYPHVYNSIARELNKYMRKYQSISGVKQAADAEFIIFFNLLEYRKPLGDPYPYGEMFVILNDTAQGRRPRIIWKTRKRSVWVEDAVKDLIRDLKTFRGEG